MEARKRKSYLSDLTDGQWELVEPMLPAPCGAGRPRRVNLRDVLNAIFYLLRTGCSWSALPHDFPPEGTVRDYFHQGKRSGLWERINGRLRERIRLRSGPRGPAECGDHRSPIGESNSDNGSSWLRCGKKSNGTKRRLAVDTLGLVLAVVVHVASIQDRDGAKAGLEQNAGELAASEIDLGGRRICRTVDRLGQRYLRLAFGDCQTELRQERLRATASPMGGGKNFLLARKLSAT